MDLPAIFQRAPELALIDELAHTNAPGLEHAKRYEDIDDVLEAGIDVYSTVNVQHLESLNDRVAELTGVRVRETFPDTVLTAADEVVLIDLTPEALIERLRAGKIYPGERIEASLNNFFRIENLATLRELALRQTAEEVEAKARPRRGRGAGRHPRAGDRGGAAGGGRAGAGPGDPAPALAATGPPRLALGPAPRRRARPALRRRARLGARVPRSASSSGPSRRLAWRARRPDADRGRRRRRRRRGRRRLRTRDHLRAHRPAAAADGARPDAGIAARAPNPQATGRRRAHRRRPFAARRAGGVSPLFGRERTSGARRILFPFLGSAISERTLDATLRLARAQDAVLIPAYLTVVPKALSLEAPLGSEGEGALAMLELIEQRARKRGVAVDSRIERGRTARHAARVADRGERFDTMASRQRQRSSDGFARGRLPGRSSRRPAR